jgi:orotidine-5'-phosphate decarboxylase
VISSEKIIVALDTSEEKKLQFLLRELAGMNIWVKVGMESFYSSGPEILQRIKDAGLKVFLDLKLHDIPNTVAQSLKALSRHPFGMVNVHAAGGFLMMRKALEALTSSSHDALLIAVTQLTSTSQEEMNKEQRIQGDLLESVVNYAKLAKEAGLHGVVSSPLEVPAIKLVCGSRFLTVTPGIRPQGFESQDQKRITTPLDAINLGVDFMVIGRPITQSATPRQTIENILKGSI